MKKIVIFLFLLVATPAIAISLIGSGISTGGGSSCGSGQIMGNSTHNSSTFFNSTGWTIGGYWTASQSIDNGCAVDIYVDIDMDYGAGIKVFITDSSGNHISSIATGTVGSAWLGPFEVTLSSAISSGSTYGLFATLADSEYIYHDNSGGDLVVDSSGSYASPPDPVATGEYGSHGMMGFYLTAQ